MLILVSHDQTVIFTQEYFLLRVLIMKAIKPLQENSGLATRDYANTTPTNNDSQ